ncbi:SRPBCC family protein [Bacillus sp. BRMEA1]|uniref:SRPBCC family protein n=1 Tax=Neobacillus endophyticus TaxID=2738405 RepID=UPI00156794B8|nr:SRPBCC family protein [Neobacillus endophyticus]NRD77043.1 SRPBCC family protein [Neobacillus endophyticus]
MWKFEHTITTTAKVETIWKLYSDITTWTEWDKGVVHASLEGAFTQGTKGILQPAGQEPLHFELTDVQPFRRFSDVTDIPALGIQVCFTHLLSESQEGTRISHKVQIIGPNADQVGPKFGAHMVDGIPQTMESLASLALDKERHYA